MRAILISAAILACVGTLSACGRREQSAEASATPAPISPAEPTWCSHGGMDAAKDPACKKQADRDFNKFIGKSGGS
jgi:hypothetical protein